METLIKDIFYGQIWFIVMTSISIVLVMIYTIKEEIRIKKVRRKYKLRRMGRENLYRKVG